MQISADRPRRLLQQYRLSIDGSTTLNNVSYFTQKM